MKIYNDLSIIKSSGKGNNDKDKLRDLPSKIPDKVDEVSHKAYIIDIDKVSKSDPAFKIDSSEQAYQVVAEVKRNIEQNPAEATDAHGHLNRH